MQLLAGRNAGRRVSKVGTALPLMDANSSEIVLEVTIRPPDEPRMLNLVTPTIIGI